MSQPSSETSPAAGANPKGGFVREWVVPVVLGLAIGGGGVWAWRAATTTGAQAVVDRWRYADGDLQEQLATELKALGHGARADVYGAFLDVPPSLVDLKVWVGGLLAGEPWFDLESLKHVVKDGSAKAIDRRAAACVLVDVLQKEIDPALVLPVFEEWMRDLSVVDHSHCVMRVDHMWRSGMLDSASEARVKAAIIPLGDRAARAAAHPRADPDEMADDRAVARYTLGLALPDEDAKKALWATALDDDDDERPRINSLRALAEGRVLDAADLPQWRAASKSASAAVRQTVADNLFRATDPAYDEVLAPLAADASPWARAGSIDTQVKRRRPTMLDSFDVLMEDHEPWVRFQAMLACAAFKSTTEGLGTRAAMMLRCVESGDDPSDVTAAVLALHEITGDAFGFQPTDIHPHAQEVQESALKAFMADAAGRAQSASRWREKFGAGCVWTDEDRAKTLEKLLSHADPANVERAKSELAELRAK